MKEENCSICLSLLDAESADILTMGAYGTPRCLCEECSRLMNTATLGRNYEEIIAAMDEIGKRISLANIDDRRVIATVSGIFDASKKRAELIKEGSYDFSLDNNEADGNPDAELPEELLESEEDRALDERDEEKRKKWDKILNWVSLGIIAAAAAFVIWYFVK